MPQFILDHGDSDGAAWFAALDSFTQGYVEGIFFTETGSDSEDLADASVAELSQVARDRIIEVCRDFQESNAEDLAAAYATGYDESRAGTDFWFTRNRHGAGFWDRGLGKVGDELSANARPYGDEYLYRGDDGLIYL